MVYLLVLISVVAMAAAQLFLKKGVLQIGGFPQSLGDLGHFLLALSTNGYIISVVLLTITTAFAWMLALSKAELSYIYPFMALSYVLVALFSIWLLNENVTALRWLGIALICLGVFFVARS